MTEKQLWLNARAPARNSRGGYEFEADYDRDRYVIETDREITTGLDEDQAQLKLSQLRSSLLKAARLRHYLDEPYPEYKGTIRQRFRIALTVADLEAVTDG